VLQARIVLACAQGGSNLAVAAPLGVNFKTVSRWRARFLAARLDHSPLAAGPPRYVLHLDFRLRRIRLGRLDMKVRPVAWVAELTGMPGLASWPNGMRLIVRKNAPA
jgi:hypothetical protein